MLPIPVRDVEACELSSSVSADLCVPLEWSWRCVLLLRRLSYLQMSWGEAAAAPSCSLLQHHEDPAEGALLTLHSELTNRTPTGITDIYQTPPRVCANADVRVVTVCVCVCARIILIKVNAMSPHSHVMLLQTGCLFIAGVLWPSSDCRIEWTVTFIQDKTVEDTRSQ